MVNAIVEGLDDADAVFDDPRPDDLRQLVVGEKYMDKLGVVGLESGNAGQSAIRKINFAKQLVGMNDFMERQVGELAFAGHPGELDETHEVKWVVVKVAGGDEATRGANHIDRSLAT